MPTDKDTTMDRLNRTLHWIETHDTTFFIYCFAALLIANILGF